MMPEDWLSSRHEEDMDTRCFHQGVRYSREAPAVRASTSAPHVVSTSCVYLEMRHMAKEEAALCVYMYLGNICTEGEHNVTHERERVCNVKGVAAVGCASRGHGEAVRTPGHIVQIDLDAGDKESEVRSLFRLGRTVIEAFPWLLPALMLVSPVMARDSRMWTSTP